MTSRVCVDPDSFNKEVIWCTIHSFYIQQLYPTLTTILDNLKNDGVFGGGRSCLWKVLQEFGDFIEEKKLYIHEQT